LAGKTLSAVVFMAAVVLAHACDIFAGICVHIRGSENVLPLAQTVAESYMKEHPDATITVSGGGTYRGIKVSEMPATTLPFSRVAPRKI